MATTVITVLVIAAALGAAWVICIMYGTEQKPWLH